MPWTRGLGAKAARGELSHWAGARGRASLEDPPGLRGGRGLEMYSNLDSWDVLGEWGMACLEKENYFDVPIAKK